MLVVYVKTAMNHTRTFSISQHYTSALLLSTHICLIKDKQQFILQSHHAAAMSSKTHKLCFVHFVRGRIRIEAIMLRNIGFSSFRR